MPTIEEQVRAVFAELGLTAERLGEAEYEAEIRAEVRRQELSGASTLPGGSLSALRTKLPSPTAEAKQASLAARLAEQEFHRTELQKYLVRPQCEWCADARVVRTPADRSSRLFGSVVPCRCVPLADRAAWAGIPERFRAVSLETMRKLPGKTAAIEWGEVWNGGSAVIASRSNPLDATWGTGKTHLVCALLLREIARGKPARFLDVTDYLDEIKARFDGDEEQAEAYQARVSAEPLLALDDVSEHRLATPWQRQQVAMIIDRRYRASLSTLITTNFSDPLQLAAALGGSVGSRLKEYAWVLVGGVDLRGAKP